MSWNSLQGDTVCTITGPAGVNWSLLASRAFVVITDCHVSCLLTCGVCHVSYHSQLVVIAYEIELESESFKNKILNLKILNLKKSFKKKKNLNPKKS